MRGPSLLAIAAPAKNNWEIQSGEDFRPSYWFQSGLLLLQELFLEMLSRIFHAYIISFPSHFTPDCPEWVYVHEGVGGLKEEVVVSKHKGIQISQAQAEEADILSSH